MAYLSVQLDRWRMCCLSPPPVPTLAAMIKAQDACVQVTRGSLLLRTVFNHLRVCVDLGLSRDVDTLGGNDNLIRFIKLAHTQSMCNIPCRCTSSFKRVLSLKNTVHDLKHTCPARKRSQYKADQETSCRRRHSLLCFIREPP